MKIDGRCMAPGEYNKLLNTSKLKFPRFFVTAITVHGRTLSRWKVVLLLVTITDLLALRAARDFLHC